MHDDSMLDNPMWNALRSRQATFGLGNSLARRYDPSIAPFAGIGEATEETEAALKELVKAGEKVGMLGVMPSFADGWEINKQTSILQMVCEGPLRQYDPNGSSHFPNRISQQC